MTLISDNPRPFQGFQAGKKNLPSCRFKKNNNPINSNNYFPLLSDPITWQPIKKFFLSYLTRGKMEEKSEMRLEGGVKYFFLVCNSFHYFFTF